MDICCSLIAAVSVRPPSLSRSNRIHPLLTLLPVGLMGSVVLFDLGAIMSGVGAFDVVAHWDMAMGLLAGLTVLTILLVDLTTALSGTAAHRVLGLVTSATATMVVVFAMVWWVREDGSEVAHLPRVLLEFAALCVGAFGVWCSRAMPERGRREPETRLGLGDV